MAQFSIKVAGAVAAVEGLFDSTPHYFRPYLTEAAAEFSVTVTPEDLRFEQAELDREAAEEGFRRREFTDPFLERAAIQRAFAEHLFDRRVLLIHGSTLAVDGRAYLFMARSGTGKSTHTRYWREIFGARAVMINDDKPFLQLTEDAVVAYGSPWSGKHGLDSNLSAPLAGICILERGAENAIRPIPAETAMAMLRKEAFCPAHQAQKLEALLEQLAAQVPLWHMHCTKDPHAAQVAFDAMSPTP